MFLIPSITPKTLQDLASKPNEHTILGKKEEELKGKWQAIRDYKRGETPLGVPQQSQVEEEDDGDDDGDDEMTEEEEEEEQDGMDEGEEGDPDDEGEEGDPEEGESEDLEQY
ncbi:g10828 [Coccomyxa elongata]